MAAPVASPQPGSPPPTADWPWDPREFVAEPELLADYRRRWPQHFVWAAENDPARWSLLFYHHADEARHPGRSAATITFGPLATNSFGRVQGGALASIFDVAMLLGVSRLGDGVGATTAYLNIRFRRPVELRTPYVVLNDCRREGRKLFVFSRLVPAQPAGTPPVVLAEADALFVIPRPDSKVQRVGQEPQKQPPSPQEQQQQQLQTQQPREAVVGPQESGNSPNSGNGGDGASPKESLL